MTYQIKSENTEFEAGLFSVKKVELSFPDGNSRAYDLVDIQDAVTILPMDDEGNVYFVRQYRVGAGGMLLELPAGKIEDGEDPASTAEREVREETGMAAGELIHLGNFYMSPGYSNEFMYCYLARRLFHDPLIPDGDEFIHLEKISFGKVKEMIRSQQICDSKTLAVFMLAESYMK